MSETIRVREGEGFDLEAVERHLRDHIDGLPEGELEVRQFPSGASNLVFGSFKLAVILQQIYARWEKGQTKDERFADFEERVRTLILHANTLAGVT